MHATFRVEATARRFAQVVAHLEDTGQITPTTGMALHRADDERVRAARRDAFLAGAVEAGMHPIQALAHWTVWAERAPVDPPRPDPRRPWGGVPEEPRDWASMPD